MGALHVTHSDRRLPRARRPRPRSCLRKGCGCKYQAAVLEPTLLPGSRAPGPRGPPLAGTAHAQANRRQDAQGKAQHAQAETYAPPGCEKSVPPAGQNPEDTPPRGHAAQPFFFFPVCDRPGCYESPVTSVRNPARYWWPPDLPSGGSQRPGRLRKWLSRGTLDGLKEAGLWSIRRLCRRQLLQLIQDLRRRQPSRAPPE